MEPKFAGTSRLRRKQNWAPTFLRGTRRNTTTGGVSDQIADPYVREALKSKKLAEDCNAQPGSGRSSLSGKGKWRGKGEGRGAQPEEEEAEDEERVADQRAAYSMEEDKEDAF